MFTDVTFCIQDSDRAKYKISKICQLDTGASCNVIGYRDLSILLQNGTPPLTKSSVKLKLYDSSIMKRLGETILKAEHKGKQYSIKFQVVNFRLS